MNQFPCVEEVDKQPSKTTSNSGGEEMPPQCRWPFTRACKRAQPQKRTTTPPPPAKKKKKERRKEEKEASVPMERRSFLEKITWSLPAADTIGAVVRSESDNQIQRKRRGEGEGERQLRRGEGLVQASNSCFCMKINPVKGRASKLTCFRAHGCVSLETK